VAALAERIERGGVYDQQGGLHRIAQLDQLAGGTAIAVERLDILA